MPYQIISESDGIYLILNDDVSFNEIRQASADGWEHENRDKNRYQIWNYQQVGKFDVNQIESIISAKMDSIAFTNAGQFTKIAFLTDRKDIIESCLTYKKYANDEILEAEVFSCEKKAREWIGIKKPVQFYSGF